MNESLPEEKNYLKMRQLVWGYTFPSFRPLKDMTPVPSFYLLKPFAALMPPISQSLCKGTLFSGGGSVATSFSRSCRGKGVTLKQLRVVILLEKH